MHCVVRHDVKVCESRPNRTQSTH